MHRRTKYAVIITGGCRLVNPFTKKLCCGEDKTVMLEDVNALGVQGDTGVPVHDGENLPVRQRAPVGSRGGEGVVHIRHGQDPHIQVQLIPRQPPKVPRPSSRSWWAQATSVSRSKPVIWPRTCCV